MTVDVQVPDGGFVERLELHRNDELVATLYQAPFKQRVELPGGEQIVYLRAAAFLTDGNSTDAVVYVNAPDYLENPRHPVRRALRQARSPDPAAPTGNSNGNIWSSAKTECPRRSSASNGSRNSRSHLEVMLDVSASMVDRLDTARQAALGLFESEIAPRDRVALVTFNDHPYLASDFTNDIGQPGRFPRRTEGRARHRALRRDRLRPLLPERDQGPARPAAALRRQRRKQPLLFRAGA